MRPSEPAFQSDALKRVEVVYRRQLAEDPADPMARISLAWCLFMQALLRAGQESVLEDLVDPTEGPAEAAPEGSTRQALDQNAAELLEDCLRQAMTVKQLSSDPDTHLSAERILSLVRLSGGGTALTAAEDRAARILSDVTREVLGGSPRRVRLRRIPSHRPPRNP